MEKRIRRQCGRKDLETRESARIDSRSIFESSASRMVSTTSLEIERIGILTMETWRRTLEYKCECDNYAMETKAFFLELAQNGTIAQPLLFNTLHPQHARQASDKDTRNSRTDPWTLSRNFDISRTCYLREIARTQVRGSRSRRTYRSP